MAHAAPLEPAAGGKETNRRSAEQSGGRDSDGRRHLPNDHGEFWLQGIASEHAWTSICRGVEFLNRSCFAKPQGIANHYDIGKAHRNGANDRAHEAKA